MPEKERMQKDELEQIAGGAMRMKIEDLLKGVVQIKHDVSGDYSERVCKYCGKIFRCAEYAYAGKMTSEQVEKREYYRSVCRECMKTHPFELSK